MSDGEVESGWAADKGELLKPRGGGSRHLHSWSCEGATWELGLGTGPSWVGPRCWQSQPASFPRKPAAKPLRH